MKSLKPQCSGNYVFSTQEILSEREYQLKSSISQLSNEVERLKREAATTQQRLDTALSDLADTRSTLSKREKELSDIQQVWKGTEGQCLSHNSSLM